MYRSWVIFAFMCVSPQLCLWFDVLRFPLLLYFWLWLEHSVSIPSNPFHSTFYIWSFSWYYVPYHSYLAYTKFISHSNFTLSFIMLGFHLWKTICTIYLYILLRYRCRHRENENMAYELLCVVLCPIYAFLSLFSSLAHFLSPSPSPSLPFSLWFCHSVVC